MSVELIEVSSLLFIYFSVFQLRIDLCCPHSEKSSEDWENYLSGFIKNIVTKTDHTHGVCMPKGPRDSDWLSNRFSSHHPEFYNF